MGKNLPTMSVHVRRVYQSMARTRGDGLRVLVDRLWPRGVAKQALEIDRWARDIAPSTELRTWYGHRPERFEEFAARYRGELRAPEASEALEQLRRAVRRRPLTLLTATRDVERSAAAVLAAVLEE
jgi:uncharacterized protein YeaO (DUF488 family)